jgi:hypothetical protein
VAGQVAHNSKTHVQYSPLGPERSKANAWIRPNAAGPGLGLSPQTIAGACPTLAYCAAFPAAELVATAGSDETNRDSVTRLRGDAALLADPVVHTFCSRLPTAPQLCVK